MSLDDPGPGWVLALCRVVEERDGRSNIDKFGSVHPDLTDERFEARVADCLRSAPDRIDGWERFSEDNRGMPASYMSGTEVGFFDGQRRDVVYHPDRFHACADFIHRRTIEILGNEGSLHPCR